MERVKFDHSFYRNDGHKSPSRLSFFGISLLFFPDDGQVFWVVEGLWGLNRVNQ